MKKSVAVGTKCPNIYFWIIIFLMTIFAALFVDFLCEVYKVGAIPTMMKKMERKGTFLPDMLPNK